MKFASESKIDALSFDGAGGGTGMSPVPMMDEMSIPTIFLQALVPEMRTDTQEKRQTCSRSCNGRRIH